MQSQDAILGLPIADRRISLEFHTSRGNFCPFSCLLSGRDLLPWPTSFNIRPQAFAHFHRHACSDVRAVPSLKRLGVLVDKLLYPFDKHHDSLSFSLESSLIMVGN